MKKINLENFKLRTSLIIAFTIFSTGNAFANLGGGGDSLFCRKEPTISNFSGYYTLDYLATYKKANNNSDIVKVNSWDESAQRIIGNLKRLKAFNLLGSFNYFHENVRNYSNFSTGIIWQEAGYGLDDIKDEDLMHKLPPNCLELKGNGEARFIQAVYWQDHKGLRIYNYDFDVLQKLENTSATQISFLYVHEWLWRHFRQPEAIRILNRLIHSEKFDSMTSEEFSMALNAFNPFTLVQMQQGTYRTDSGDEMLFSFDQTIYRTDYSFRFDYTGLINVGFVYLCNYTSSGSQVCLPGYLPGEAIHEGVEPANYSMEILSFSSFRLIHKDGTKRVFKFYKY